MVTLRCNYPQNQEEEELFAVMLELVYKYWKSDEAAESCQSNADLLFPLSSFLPFLCLFLRINFAQTLENEQFLFFFYFERQNKK